MSEVISRELAEQEFDRFLKSFGFRKPTSKKPEMLEAYESMIEPILDALVDGSLVMNDEGEPVYTPVRTDVGAITFHEGTGADLQVGVGVKNLDDVSRANRIMASLTRKDAKFFANLKLADYKICQAILTVFLAC